MGAMVPKGELMGPIGTKWEPKGGQIRAQRVPRDQNESPKGAKWEPMGATWEPKGSKIGAEESPRTKDRESEKHKITKSRKVEKSWKFEEHKSGNVDISFILQWKLITPKKIKKF